LDSAVNRGVAVKTLAALSLVIFTSSAYAQAPPRPAVRINQLRPFAQDTWPADVNRDGRTDLVGSIGAGPASKVAVAIGRGDGTFGAARPLGVAATPIAVGDFNNDGRVDIVVSGVAILPGNGDGTFRAARPVTGPPAPPVFHDDIKTSHALAADFNGDGRRDLGLITSTSFDIHPGNGDFTFAPPVSLPVGDATSGGPRQAISADFNRDGRRDLAVITFFSRIDVFINRGGLLFAASSIATTQHAELWGITAGDLNRDGNPDIVVTSTFMGGSEWTASQLFTFLGNGNGTFQPPASHPTGKGALTVVVGDFNRDGLLDAATGNRSWVYRDLSCANAFQYWDSVSIVAGKGDGTFAAPATFHLDYTNDDPTYQNTHNALKTSDVNGDGRTDLIASPGAILLNAPAAANRPPILFEGPNLRMVDQEHGVRFTAEIRDPDHDILSIVWTDSSGRRIGDTPVACGQFFSSTTVAVTLTDDRGASVTDTVRVFVPAGPVPYFIVTEPDRDETVSITRPFTIQWDTDGDPRLKTFDVWSSSDDGETWTRIAGCAGLPSTARACRWSAPGPVTTRARVRVVAFDGATMSALAVSDRFRIVSGPPTSLPDFWFNGDIGQVAAAGSATFDGTAFTVRGSGADIGGTADAFHFAGIAIGGDFSITARVASIQNVHPSTRVGIMIRQYNNASGGAPHGAVLVTPANGTSFRRRTTQGGSTLITAGPATTAPIWLKLVRSGSLIQAFYRKLITDRWTLVGTQSMPSAFDPGIAMLVVSSHVDGTLASGVFDNVVVDNTEAMQTIDLGGSAPGTMRFDGATTTLEGNGAGIWGTADAFRFHHTQWFGDGTITVRLRSLENTSTGAKAGLMFRESLTPDSKHAMAAVYAAGGIVLQSRSATGGTTTENARRSGAAPEWLRLTRAGNTFSAATSNDGVTWTGVGYVTVPMGQSIYVGLPVTSRVAGTLATAVFDDLWIRP
jgi:hypothetical protein